MMVGPGSLIGPYEITSPLGTGGMGEVFQARDTRLGRPVAIKIIRDSVAGSPTSLERFQHEARAAAALNHPNVCAIYDVGTDPPFIAMELLEGETLHWRLTRSGMSLPELLDIALAIADALAYAHVRGIVHRDIKPANVFLTPRGPKLLDFGLAKIVAPVGVGAATDVTHSMPSPLTEPGVTVGTVAYMSPEQLRGLDLDTRTDLFSVGLLLYEMATGRSAFQGETGAAVAGAILHERPVPPSRTQPSLPARFDDIVLKALEKECDDRYQTAGDLRADLRRLKREIDATSDVAVPAAKTSEGQVSTASAPRSAESSDSQVALALARRHAAGLTIAALAIGIAVAGGAYWLYVVSRTRTPDPDANPTYDITQLTTSGNAERPAIAPAGNYVAYVRHVGNDYSLWVRQTATANDVQIVGPEKGVQLLGATVTPDSNYVDFVRNTVNESAELWRIPFLGGAAKRINDDVASLTGWSPDAKHMAFVRLDPNAGLTALIVSDADGSHERVVATRTMPLGFVNININSQFPNSRPAWSADGRGIAAGVFDAAPGSPHSWAVGVYDTRSGSEQVVDIPGSGLGGVAWLAGPSLVVSGSASALGPGQLYRLLYPSGRPIRLTNDLNVYDGLTTTSDGSVLTTARVDVRASISVGRSDGTEWREILSPTPVDGLLGFGLAWSGDRLLYTGPGAKLMRASAGGGPSEEVATSGNFPAATPDGRTIFYAGAADGKMWKANADGSHPVVVGAFGIDPTVTSDGRSIVYESIRSGAQSPWVLPIQGGTPTRISTKLASGLDVSPDGTLIVFLSLDERLNPTVVLCRMPTCGEERVVTHAIGGGRLRFTPNGRGVAYVDAPHTNLWVLPLTGTEPRQLTHFSDGRSILDFAWSWDGKQLAVARTTTTSDIVLLSKLNASTDTSKDR